MTAQTRKNRQNFRNFLFENDELLKKILLSKKFINLIKEYAVIFSEFFEKLKKSSKNSKKITAYSLIKSKNFVQQNFFQKSIIFK